MEMSLFYSRLVTKYSRYLKLEQLEYNDKDNKDEGIGWEKKSMYSSNDILFQK